MDFLPKEWFFKRNHILNKYSIKEQSMIIHVVQTGETLESIAQLYQVSLDRLMIDNDVIYPNQLVIGQTIVVLFPAQTYVVQEGDTLESIAISLGVEEVVLLRNNIFLTARNIIPGETLVVSYTDEKIQDITVNGYALPFIHHQTLIKTLPYLTYLTIFLSHVNADASITPIDDKPLIDLAYAHNVLPIMLVSPLMANGFLDTSILHTILESDELQMELISNVLEILARNNYAGANLDFQYVLPNDKEQFLSFMERITRAIKDAGFLVFQTISPTIFELNTGTIYDDVNYTALGDITDETVLIYYDWCAIKHYPRGLATIESAANYIENITTMIDPSKISLGVSTIGYIWQIPFLIGVSTANSISNPAAIELAANTDSEIYYHEATASPYFSYSNYNEFLVWFRDARTIDATSTLLPENNLRGISMWNIMQFFPQAWLVINSQYQIIQQQIQETPVEETPIT